MDIKFPVYAKSIHTNLVVKFSSLDQGIVVKADDRYQVGYNPIQWAHCTDVSVWAIIENFKEEPTKAKIDVGTKYQREIKAGVWIDVYDVLAAFDVKNPATQHLLKKALMSGTRGHKNLETDMNEVVVSAIRAIEIEGFENAWKKL